MKTVTLSLKSKEIVDKIFKGVPRGYDPFEVDEYLDKIIKDYKLVESNVLASLSEIQSKDREIKELNEKIKALELDNSKLKAIVGDIKPSSGVTSDNIKLLKRINALEKALVAKGVNPKTIR